MHYFLPLETIFEKEEEGIQGMDFSLFPNKQTTKMMTKCSGNNVSDKYLKET
jgi:hypothetical protein